MLKELILEPETSPQLYLKTCPICNSTDLQYLFISYGLPIAQCRDCRLILRNPQPSAAVLTQIYSEHYFLVSDSSEQQTLTANMKQATARLYLDCIETYHQTPGKRLLEVGCGHGEFLLEAQTRGYQVTGIEVSPNSVEIAKAKLQTNTIFCGQIEQLDLPAYTFDICVLSDVIEHVRNPATFLETIHTLLKPDGTLFIATPSLDSWSARLLRQNWMEFKTEHLFYFDRQTIQHLLFKTGYQEIVVQPGKKVLNQDYVHHHFERFPVFGLTFLMRWVYYLIPKRLRQRNITVNPSGIIVMGRAKALVQPRKLSIIVPVYNEKNTVCDLMDCLVCKEIADLDIEIIVVESNSTDGTRQEVLRYKDHPRVKVVLEENPQGKGHAVRTGFQHISGDFVLIQDADLEYDLNDYQILLEPLLKYHKAFVLGSRHQSGNSWKLRQFETRPWLSLFLNFGHVLFTTLLNLLYGQRLKDPFTMYKVFKRDCLYGLNFECNRFDFDFELVIKLIRKGYKPIEIPVNYKSRSFADGKKVSIFRDPPTWIKALIKYRFV